MGINQSQNGVIKWKMICTWNLNILNYWLIVHGSLGYPRKIQEDTHLCILLAWHCHLSMEQFFTVSVDR